MFVRMLGLLLLSFLIGCGDDGRPPLVPVSGVVTLDNEPVAGAAVMFMPLAGGRPAQGVTDAAGKFRLSTFEDNDGALVGNHQVTITKVEVTGMTATADGLSGLVDPSQIKETWIIPQKYAQPDSSGLSATVAKGMDEVTFSLTK